MMPEVNTLDFAGNAVTMLGLVGVISTFIILLTIFKSFNNSPLRK